MFIVKQFGPTAKCSNVCISLVALEKVSGKGRKLMWGTAPEEKPKKKNRSAIAEHFFFFYR